MLKSIEHSLSIESNNFIDKAIKTYINTYYKSDNLNDFSCTKIIEEKSKTLKYIRMRRKDYRSKISSIESNIKALENNYRALEIEKNERITLVKNNKEFILEEHTGIEDIENAINENIRIIEREKEKYKELRNRMNIFNSLSIEDERLVYYLFSFIRKEFFKERKNILEMLYDDESSESDCILAYEYISIITKKMLLVEEELFGG